MEKYENAVKEVEIPDSGTDGQVENSCEESHEPFIRILVRLNILKLKVFTKFKEIELEDLFKYLQNPIKININLLLPNLSFIKVEKR